MVDSSAITVAPSTSEGATSDAHERLLVHGLCVFERALPVSLIDACRPVVALALTRLDADLETGGYSTESRTRVKVRAAEGSMDEPPLGDALLHQRAPWLPLVHATLGEDALELWRGVLDNKPGSSGMRWHRDGEYLEKGYEQADADCLNVFVPLIDVTAADGPTEFMPGSHYGAALHDSGEELAEEGELPACSPLLQRGDAVVFDFRLVHRGTPNVNDGRQGRSRPMLYIIYGRSGKAANVPHHLEAASREGRPPPEFVAAKGGAC